MRSPELVQRRLRRLQHQSLPLILLPEMSPDLTTALASNPKSFLFPLTANHACITVQKPCQRMLHTEFTRSLHSARRTAPPGHHPHPSDRTLIRRSLQECYWVLPLHALSHRPMQSHMWSPGAAGTRASRACQAGKPRRRRAWLHPCRPQSHEGRTRPQPCSAPGRPRRAAGGAGRARP